MVNTKFQTDSWQLPRTNRDKLPAISKTFETLTVVYSTYGIWRIFAPELNFYMKDVEFAFFTIL